MIVTVNVQLCSGSLCHPALPHLRGGQHGKREGKEEKKKGRKEEKERKQESGIQERAVENSTKSLTTGIWREK